MVRSSPFITAILASTSLFLRPPSSIWCACVYAVLSFTVARRTREIGVRVALGASPARLVAAIFRRPLTHVTLGVLTGGALITLMAFAAAGGDGGLAGVEGGVSLANVAMVLAYAALMPAVCLLACVVPTWRALSVEPTEALRAE
jgi:putative ABC transport system permease protein